MPRHWLGHAVCRFWFSFNPSPFSYEKGTSLTNPSASLVPFFEGTFWAIHHRCGFSQKMGGARLSPRRRGVLFRQEKGGVWWKTRGL